MILPEFWKTRGNNRKSEEMMESLSSFPYQQTKGFLGCFERSDWENILRILLRDWLVAGWTRYLPLRPRFLHRKMRKVNILETSTCKRRTWILLGFLKNAERLVINSHINFAILSLLLSMDGPKGQLLPSETRARALQPSLPIQLNLPVTPWRLTARIRPATSWSEPKMITPESEKNIY